MDGWPDELRLLATLAANALVLAGAWRIARRNNARAVVALPDALLLWLATQYLVVGLCGMLGVLRPIVFLPIAAGLLWVPRISTLIRARPATDGTDERTHPWHLENRIALAALAFVLAYGGAFLWHQRFAPELATDPLVYHLPAAAKWIQDQRIGLLDAWYWIPANAYSPLAGSVWIAWWLAPVGNDSLARFVQFPAWVLLFAASVRLLRDLRTPAIVAATGAIAVVVTRPFVSQLIIAKDDVAVAALAVTLLGALHARRLREPIAPIRIGVALGLLMSVKYVSALAAPALIPAVVLMRWRSLGARRTIAAATLAIAFVAPWLVRNAIYAGNPFWPLIGGDAGYFPDPAMRSVAGIWAMLAGGFHSLPPVLWAIALVAAVVVVVARRRVARENVLASLLLGPPIALAAMLVACPWPEVRYLFTAIACAMLLVGVACGTLRDRRLGALLAGIVSIASMATSFQWSFLPIVAGFAVSGLVGTAVAVALIGLGTTWRWRIVGVALVGLLLWTYVGWRAYLRHEDAGYARGTDEAYKLRYGEAGAMWATIRQNMPPTATIAFANTPTIYPLFGFELTHRVVYAPVRPNVAHQFDLPRRTERVPAKDEYVAATAQMNLGADASVWLANLERLNVDYVYVAKNDASPDPPELRFIAEHPERFTLMTQNAAAGVWQFKR